MSEDKYLSAVERFGNKYSQMKGIISIEPDDFGADIIVVLVDDLRYKNLDLPKDFCGYEVSTVAVYALRDAYQDIVDRYVLSDPDIWDTELKIPFEKSLNLLDETIDDYERKVEESINNSLLKMRDTMRWIIEHNPPPKKARP